MYKLSLLVAATLLLASSALSAQKGIEIGVHFTPGSSWILNSEDFAEDDDLNFRGTFGYNVGATLGFNLTDGFGIGTGIIYNKGGQNYITGYDGVAKADQNTFARQLSYIRVPILLKVNGSLDAGSSSFFRIGPHFDFIQKANYNYKWNSGILPAPGTEINEDMLDYSLTGGTPYKIYNKMVIGLTLEMGGQINITESLKLIMALHLSGSLTNSEDEDAPYVYPSTGTLLSPERSTAWNTMVGFTVGMNYVLSFD
jgi:hypothetical protein